jgi:hypothetical protein
MKTLILPFIVLLPVVADAAHITVSVTPETAEKYGLDVEIQAVAQTVKEGDKPARVTGHMYFITIKSGKLDLKHFYPHLILEDGKDSYLRAPLRRDPLGLEDGFIHLRVTCSLE